MIIFSKLGQKRDNFLNNLQLDRRFNAEDVSIWVVFWGVTPDVLV